MEIKSVWFWSKQHQLLCLKCPFCQNQHRFIGLKIGKEELWQCEVCGNQKTLDLTHVQSLTTHIWSISLQPYLN